MLGAIRSAQQEGECPRLLLQPAPPPASPAWKTEERQARAEARWPGLAGLWGGGGGVVAL